MSLPEKLIKSAKAGNSREVRKLLGRGVPITKDKFGNTALHEAAWNGHSDIVKLLLNSFCFVDSINNSGFTPLHLASQSGHGKTVKTLLKWRADPSLHNQHGETAIHLAAKYNHPTVISVFVSFKVSVDIRGKDGNTALHLAAKLGNTESVRALLRGGANPHLMNVRGARPLEYAEIGGFKPVIKMLNSKLKVRARSSPDSKPSSRTPTPTERETPGKRAGGSPPVIAHSSPRLQRANSASARFNFHAMNKKQNSVPSGLTSSVQVAQQSQREPSPSNSYEEIPPLNPSSPKGPTIDQMLEEIEHECHGPDYKYIPHPLAPSDEVSPYKFSPPRLTRGVSHEAWVSPQGSMTPTVGVRHSSRRSSLQDCPYHYKSASLDGFETQREGEGGLLNSHLSSLPPHEMRAVESVVDRTFEVYETIPYHPSSDDDTYVYMASCRDVQSGSPQLSLSSQESGAGVGDTKSKIPKRAIICSSPLVPGQRHEPNVSLTPSKGILSQSSSLQQSEVERYLQDELETMRKAFQIRLGQLEKRYQRQLWMAQQRNSTAAAVASEDVSLRPASVGGNPRHRRSSWHSCLSDSDYEDLEPGHVQPPRCGSSQGFDSDCNVESDDDAFNQSDARIRSHDLENSTTQTASFGGSGRNQKNIQRSHSLAVNHSPQRLEGLRGGARMWNVEPGNGARAGPQLPAMQDEQEEVDTGTLPPRAKALVNERVSEHRERILQYFQQVSEAKISAIEQQYEAQMAEVENRYRNQATEKLSQLETRVKDLEKMLEIETVV